jgi:hypothetical protein
MIAAAAGTSWSFDPLELAPTVAVSYLYLSPTRSLARRGLPVERSRQWLFWTGSSSSSGRRAGLPAACHGPTRSIVLHLRAAR